MSAPLRMVLVTMDSHLSTAAARAAERLERELPGFQLAVHAADEWHGDDGALGACLSDIAQADIVVATMLFLDDHIRPVLPALAARRDHCAAMLCCLSAGEVVRLTRLGRFDMSAESGGALALLKKLRGAKKHGTANSGEKQMRMLKRLPKLLRFIPGAAQDARAYFLSMQYWLAGSEENIGRLLRLLATRYGGAALPSLPARAELPAQYPECGLYHPRLRDPGTGRITEDAAALPARADAVGTVGVLLMRSYVLAGNTAHYDGVIEALEAKGLRVLPAFASGLDSRPAIERFFKRNGVPAVDALLSLTGFSLVGGPAYNDAHAAAEALAALDVPYVAAHPVEFQTLERWEADGRGLSPVEAAMMVAIPELDGALWPMPFGGRSENGTAKRDMVAHPERAVALASRVAGLVALRRGERARRRVAVVLFNFPPNGGNTGTAAYLSVFASLWNVLRALRDGGYAVDLPANVDALRCAVLDGNREAHGTVANVMARVPVDVHVKREPHLAVIERQWGPAPGAHDTDGRDLLVLGARFGAVAVAIQPAMGVEGDPMRLLFEGSWAPTHAFCNFYRWMREDLAADAVLHFGTHGALEFMPGKQCGMSGECWPDRLIGSLPNFYLYASNNPSEGALAKRRSGATLISYLTPPVARAGLYRGLAELRASLDRWRALEPGAPVEQRAMLAELLQAQAAAVELDAAAPAWADADAAIERLRVALVELEHALIPAGLHVVGTPPDAAARAATLDALEEHDPVERAALDARLAADTELPAILRALDGRYLRPAPGGDLVRSRDVLPTGRNLHGFDPFRIPSAFALRDGARQAERLVARHVADQGVAPETVAMVLWGTDNLKTEGGPIGQVLWLLGAEPRLDGYGRLCGAKLVPLEAMGGRPRIDVMVTLSGIFRDLLPMQTRMLAEASLLAAEADEPEALNFVRRHALAFQREHGGTLADAALRVFGNADGAYGSNVNHLLDHGGWADEDELSRCFLRRKGFAYAADGSAPRRHDALLGDMIGRVDVAYQNLESVELGVTTVDHYFDTLGGIARAVRSGGREASVYIGDQTRGDGVVRTLAEQVALETRTRALNPRWYEPLLDHGHEGVRHIEAHVTNTLGWSATTGQVAPWIYQSLSETFVLDEAMRERLGRLNPAATLRIAERLLEAHDRHYWEPDPEVLDRLRRGAEDLEDRLEGLAPKELAPVEAVAEGIAA